MPRAPAGPKAPVNFSSSLVIADSVALLGHHTINISSESVVHPRAKLDSSNGRITVGRRCIIHERTLLGAPSEDKTPVDSRDGVVLSDYVTVDVGAVIEAGGTTIGDFSTIGVGCRVGRGAKLGKHCTLTPRSIILPGERVPDFTVVYSNGSQRTDKRHVADLKHKIQARQIDVLRRLIPSNPAKFQ